MSWLVLQSRPSEASLANLSLWIVQGLLAVGFLAAGMFKIVTPREKLMVKLRWAEGYSPAQIKQLGLAEVLGAVGLVVPLAQGAHQSALHAARRDLPVTSSS